MREMIRRVAGRGDSALWDAAAFAGLALAIVTGFSAGSLF